ncbi:MAG: universal stress protein [Chitinophagaceae bacterium]|nr:universal stress protein [Chitinophagaceae bacterium]
MKNILVPVDFSDASANALRFSFALNRHFFAKVNILHLFDVPITTGDDSELYLRNYQAYRKSYDDDLWDFVKNNRGDYHYETEVFSTSGGHYQGIVDFARKHPTDLTIIGNKGAGGLRRWMFGSVARYLLTHPPVPVLAIPEHFDKSDIKRIVLATDLSGLMPEPRLHFMKTFAENCKAELKVIHVRDRNEIKLPGEEKVLDQIKDCLGIPCETINVLPGETISIVINRYLNDHGCDLLVTIPHTHTWLDRLLIGSETRELASLIQVPIMSLPGK